MYDRGSASGGTFDSSNYNYHSRIDPWSGTLVPNRPAPYSENEFTATDCGNCILELPSLTSFRVIAFLLLLSIIFTIAGAQSCEKKPGPCSHGVASMRLAGILGIVFLPIILCLWLIRREAEKRRGQSSNRQVLPDSLQNPSNYYLNHRYGPPDMSYLSDPNRQPAIDVRSQTNWLDRSRADYLWNDLESRTNAPPHTWNVGDSQRQPPSNAVLPWYGMDLSDDDDDDNGDADSEEDGELRVSRRGDRSQRRSDRSSRASDRGRRRRQQQRRDRGPSGDPRGNELDRSRAGQVPSPSQHNPYLSPLRELRERPQPQPTRAQSQRQTPASSPSPSSPPARGHGPPAAVSVLATNVTVISEVGAPSIATVPFTGIPIATVVAEVVEE